MIPTDITNLGDGDGGGVDGVDGGGGGGGVLMVVVMSGGDDCKGGETTAVCKSVATKASEFVRKGERSDPMALFKCVIDI